MSYVVVCGVALMVSGLTLFSGFGLGTLLMPTFALFFPVEVAVAATAVVHLANNVFKLFLVGQYPSSELWRVQLSLVLIGFLFGLSWGVWGGLARNVALALALALGLAAVFPVSLEQLAVAPRVWLMASPAAIILGHFVGQTRYGVPRLVLFAGIGIFYCCFSFGKTCCNRSKYR